MCLIPHLVRHRSTKSLAAVENFSESCGTGPPDPMANIADIGGMSAHGGFLVAISITVQPILL